MTDPGNREAETLYSITSTSIQKISLVIRCPYGVISRCITDWEIFDEPLYRMADRPGRTHKLEVDIDIRVTSGVVEVVDGGAGLVGIADSLARFKEKGHLRVTWAGASGRENVVYPPPLSSAE